MTNEFMKIFGSNLKTARTNSDITQKEFAAILGLAERSYQRYENGSNTPPYDTLVKIADHLNVSVDYLLNRTDDPTFNPVRLK